MLQLNPFKWEKAKNSQKPINLHNAGRWTRWTLFSFVFYNLLIKFPCTSSGLWLENLQYKGFCVQGSLKQNVVNSQDHCLAEQLHIFYFTLPLNLICSCCNTLPKKLNHFLLITDSDIISIRVFHSTMPGRDAVGKNKLLCFKNVHRVTTSCSEKKNFFPLFPERSLYLKESHAANQGQSNSSMKLWFDLSGI